MKSLSKRGRIFLAVLLGIIILLFGVEGIFAQDVGTRATIHKVDGTTIEAFIVRDRVDGVVEYRLWDQFETNGGANGIIREILKKDIHKIEYKNGKTEVYMTLVQPEPEPVAQQPTNQPEPAELVEPEESEKEKPRWNPSFGVKAGFFIPTNKKISEIYGAGLMFGGTIGYKTDNLRVELDFRFYRKKGEPYIYGNIDYIDPILTFFPATLSANYTLYKEGNLEAYVSAGGGVCIYKIGGPVSAFGGSTRNLTSKIQAVGMFHLGGGIKFNIFNLGISFSAAPVPEKDMGFGGIFISGGVIF